MEDTFLNRKHRAISFLLGAGFSVPAGYPTGANINEFFTKGCFEYRQKEILELLSESHNTTFLHGFKLCKTLIEEYLNNQEFDYEEFFDHLYSDNIRNQYDSEILHSAKQIYKRGVRIALRKKDDYDENVFQLGEVDFYHNFLTVLKHLTEIGYIVHVHTLNHDSLFESFENSELFSGMCSDGFSTDNSTFYYDDEKLGQQNRIPQFNDHYSTPVRLYKMHGSFNYANTCTEEGESACIKIPYGVSYHKIYTTIQGCKNYNIPIDETYILTGKSLKEQRYNEDFPKRIIKHFQENILESEQLIIIGYGAKDNGINSIIETFDYVSKPVKYIASKPSDAAKGLASRLGITIIEKDISSMQQIEIYDK